MVVYMKTTAVAMLVLSAALLTGVAFAFSSDQVVIYNKANAPAEFQRLLNSLNGKDVADVGGLNLEQASKKTGLSEIALSKASLANGGDGWSFTKGTVIASVRSIVGPPSLSVDQVRKVLAHYHSPALGSEQCFYDLSKKYNIDVAYMLGFFRRESGFGKAAGYSEHHSIGNIGKKAPGRQFCSPSKRTSSRFCGYENWCLGAEHFYYYLKNSPLYLPKNKVTMAEIMPIYAPSSDGNDPTGYASDVNRCVDDWRAGNYC